MARKTLPLPTLKNLVPVSRKHQYFANFVDQPFQPSDTRYSLVNAWWLAEMSLLVYGQEPFVRLLEPPALPDTKNVTGTNVIEIAWRLDPRTGRLIVMSALDNITKGASGQAVQSLNILRGFPETAGLG